jgi:hypothetical protein
VAFWFKVTQLTELGEREERRFPSCTNFTVHLHSTLTVHMIPKREVMVKLLP